MLIVRTGLPLSIIEDASFRMYIHQLHLRVKLPSRRTLSDKLIPGFAESCVRTHMVQTLQSCASISVSFNLRMSRGNQNMLDLIAHGMYYAFTRCQVHLKMIQCNETTGIRLASALEDQLRKHSLQDKGKACVKDGGSNVSACMNILNTLVR